MIVKQIGYLTVPDIEKYLADGVLFSIYETHKNTKVLVLGSKDEQVHLYYPKKDRLPYKLLEGKKIARGNLIYLQLNMLILLILVNKLWLMKYIKML